MVAAETSHQGTCLQVEMASETEMMVLQEDLIVDHQEAAGLSPEVGSEMIAEGVTSEEAMEIEMKKNRGSSRKVSALFANNQAIWREIALSKVSKIVREAEVVSIQEV
jgi:hypothetical protein